MSGTDRVALASKNLNYDFIINIQGDEPLLDPKDIKECIKLKHQFPNYVFNGFTTIGDNEDINSRNIPKLVTNDNNDLIYISRAPIPSQKDISSNFKIKYKRFAFMDSQKKN